MARILGSTVCALVTRCSFWIFESIQNLRLSYYWDTESYAFFYFAIFSIHRKFSFLLLQYFNFLWNVQYFQMSQYPKHCNLVLLQLHQCGNTNPVLSWSVHVWIIWIVKLQIYYVLGDVSEFVFVSSGSRIFWLLLCCSWCMACKFVVMVSGDRRRWHRVGSEDL